MSKTLHVGKYDAPSYNLGKRAGRAECVAGPPQWEPPGEGDDGWWLWAALGDDEELTEIQPGYKVRESWTDGEWCAPLRTPERRGE